MRVWRGRSRRQRLVLGLPVIAVGLVIASLAVPCGGAGEDLVETIDAPDQPFVLALQRTDGGKAFELSAGAGAQNRAAGAFNRVVVLYPDGATARKDDLLVFAMSGSLPASFLFDDASHLGIWTFSFEPGEHLLELRAGTVSLEVPLRLVGESAAADDPCREKPLGFALNFPHGVLVPAVGATGRAAVSALFHDSNFTLEPLFVSRSPELLRVEDGEFHFQKAGAADLTAVTCGMLSAYRLKVAAGVGETAACKEITFGIADYANDHPGCMQKQDGHAPEGCGPTWIEVLRRCETLAASACAQSDAMTLCEELL